ncbi:MAG TPA: hypothetical protein DD379_20845 [Cyanobacteria bacterium UBA11162]|nr:hypothetical protein [Cyanobacteria bacterium UBA11162]
MKTDTIFYSLFQAFPSIFFELIERSPEAANSYEFTSREIKQLSFRLDGLFFPTNNDPEQPFYVVEVQFQPDETLYYRLFGELFLFLRQYQPSHPWQVVVIYPSRTVERLQTVQFKELLSLNRVKRIYLDELGSVSESSLGVGVVKLVIESEATAPQLARRLIEDAREQLTDEEIRRELIELIETIIIYKLPLHSRQEIETMLGLAELKQTKVYQEAKEEGKLEAIPRLLELGLSEQAIAEALDLSLKVVQSTAQLFYQQNITAFLELLKNQRTLFSIQDLNELAGLITPLADKIEDLSSRISIWCKQEEHLAQFNALKQVRQTLSSGIFEQGLGTNMASVKSFELTINKQMLLEAIQLSELDS